VSCNERLLDAMNRATTTPVALAERIAVDPKTVERWVTQGRVPYPRHRHELAALLGESEAWLWPDAYSADRVGQAARSEVVTVYGHRYQIPAELWARLVGEATTFLDILVYAGLFLPEQTAGLSERLIDQAAAGVRVRILLGDPATTAVQVRGSEEGIGDAVAIKIRNALHLYRRLADSPVQVRLHSTTLYTSLYRSDDEMIANPHVLGLPAAQSPALHLRKLAAGDLFDTYTACFDRVWDSATPAWG